MIDSLEGVAPTVERWTPNPTVVGSNPIALTFYYFCFIHGICTTHLVVKIVAIHVVLIRLFMVYDNDNSMDEI